MFRRIVGLLAVLVAVVLSLAVAPSFAQAQADDAPEYPGPFNDTADDAADDEVLGDSLDAEDASGSSTGLQPVGERSIDYLGDDNATRFAAPDLSLSAADAAAIGGTGGGLAVTGTDVEPIVALSAGLLALGGAALVSSRRRLRDFFV